MDNDAPGKKAAMRWAEQLKSAGCVVDGYSFDGLRRWDGFRVKDLNDFLLIDCDAWEENRAATIASAMDFAFKKGWEDGWKI